MQLEQLSHISKMIFLYIYQQSTGESRSIDACSSTSRVCDKNSGVQLLWPNERLPIEVQVKACVFLCRTSAGSSKDYFPEEGPCRFGFILALR